jgi:hypothetical protein
MVAKLLEALESGTPVTGELANFYMHELNEATSMLSGQ